tara:strand:- start:6596 stop:6931 length:336 start_codon:yes stop_codon:yes gene_type:complete
MDKQTSELQNNITKSNDTQVKPKKIDRPAKQCPYCCRSFSYYNYASHEKRCKVKLNQNISITNNEIDMLRKENQDLRFDNSLWQAKYIEVKNINDRLLSKFPRITERVILD